MATLSTITFIGGYFDRRTIYVTKEYPPQIRIAISITPTPKWTYIENMEEYEWIPKEAAKITYEVYERDQQDHSVYHYSHKET